MVDSAILVGDVGGTHARFALAGHDGALSQLKSYKVADFATSEEAVDTYLGTISVRPKTLCLASAGLRQGDTITLTNSHWVIGEAALKARFGFSTVRLLNDFEALALGAATLSSGEMVEVQKGEANPAAPRLCLGPGTGFGQALVLPGQPPRIIPTEGGFRLLPVRTERDHALFRQLEAAGGIPPIVEEALSGRGLVHLLGAIRGAPQEMEPSAITAAALAGPGDERDAAAWFFELLANTAADACLMMGAYGGVMIGGGVVPHLLDLFDHQAFCSAFARSSPMQQQLKRTPIHLITDGTVALKGAAAAVALNPGKSG